MTAMQEIETSVCKHNFITQEPPSRQRGVIGKELRYAVERVVGAQVPAVSRGGHVARTATRIRDLTGKPSTAKLAASGVLLTPALDPRVVTLVKILGHVVPRGDRGEDLDPPIEREMSIPLLRDERDQER